MKGLGLNAGFISWWDQQGNDDALVLKILWNAGCVFYARTTQPQTLMHLETSSNLYGTTINPFNSQLTCGGSSGGEGALIGMRGSCLGVGSDIGGSVRSPAANCGLYGLRPSSYRIPMGGLSATMYAIASVSTYFLLRFRCGCKTSYGSVWSLYMFHKSEHIPEVEILTPRTVKGRSGASRRGHRSIEHLP